MRAAKHGYPRAMNQGYPPPPQGYPQPGYPQQGYSGQPGFPQQPPPKKKGMSGCLLAALIVGGLGLVTVLVVGVLVVKAAKTITAAAEEGLNAPGAAELRAAGCEAAVVMDMAKISSLFDAGGGTSESVIVSCGVAPAKPAPKCDDLAKTYAKAVGGAHGNFVVVVQPQGGGNPTCKKVYGPTGTFLHDQR
jgi:hypothetical protein